MVDADDTLNDLEGRLESDWGATLQACGMTFRDAPDLDVTIRMPPTAAAVSDGDATLAPPPGAASDTLPDLTALGPSLDLADELPLAAEIGAGGMGVIYEAEQRSLGRQVAVKALKPARQHDPSWLKAFAEEARVTARLDHPHIVPVYALGRGAGGELLLAMKRIEGRAWSALLRAEPASTGPASLRRHLEVFQKVVEAIAFAHDRGFIHRDLKPENVMVGEYGEVYVLDWGLAIPIPSAGPESEDAPRPAGTPAYMAPEMADCGPLSPATDVYLLGATLHDVVYGRPPHRGKSLISVLAAAIRNDVLPLPELPAAPALLDVLQRCLASEPDERYARAGELREAVARFLSGEARREESEELTRKASALVGAVPPEPEALDPAAASEQYGTLFEADGYLQAALQAWPENPGARDLQGRLEATLVHCALAAGDLALADSFLRRAALDPARSATLKTEIDQRRREASPEHLLELDRARERARDLSGCAMIWGGLLSLTSGAAWFGIPGDKLSHFDELFFISVFVYCLPGCLIGTAQYFVARKLEPRRRGRFLTVAWLTAAMLLFTIVWGARTYYAFRLHFMWYWTLLFIIPVTLYADTLRKLLSARVRALFPEEGSTGG